MFLTLYLRALDCRRRNPILGDTLSAELVDKIDYDFKTRQSVGTSLVLDLACRTRTLDQLIRDFAAQHPNALVLDLGCGLDPRAIRCGLSPSADWYDIDYPVVIDTREQFLPPLTHTIRADLTTPGWMDAIPAERPTMIVADGLMAFITGEQYKNMTRALTAHFHTGEFAFNSYLPITLRMSKISSTWKKLGATSPGAGISDPREPEGWGARLTLIEELLLVNSPDVAKYPQPLRAFTQLCAHSTRISRVGNWVLRYRF
jgi:O-methyltransferase involved in polyketide biosynthesis